MQYPQVTLTRDPVDPDPRALAAALSDLNAAKAREVEADIAEAQAVYDQVQQPSHRYTAHIGAEVFPVDDFAVQQVDGRMILSLVFEAGSLQVPEPSAGTTTQMLTPPPPKPDDNRRGVWGKPGRDPREILPGWKSEVSK